MGIKPKTICSGRLIHILTYYLLYINEFFILNILFAHDFVMSQILHFESNICEESVNQIHRSTYTLHINKLLVTQKIQIFLLVLGIPLSRNSNKYMHGNVCKHRWNRKVFHQNRAYFRHW